MTPRRSFSAVLGWGLVTFGVGILASPWVHLVHRRLPTLHVMAQSLVPWAGLLAVPPAGLAVARGDRALGGASTALAAGGLAAAAWVNGRPRRAIARPGPAVSIAHFNLLYINEQLDRDVAVIGGTDADVLTFCELTPRHLHTLHGSGLADRYPHRVESPGPYATGTALWSRFPLTAVEGPEIEHHTVAADIDTGAGRPTRVVVIHTRSPMHHVGEWIDDLHEIEEEPIPDERPAVIIGDFNAAWGHPGFRALARAGWRDAHRALGRGLTNSWPTDRRWAPPFVRLDHALVNRCTEVVRATDVDVPGSDHRGIVVSVRPVARPTR